MLLSAGLWMFFFVLKVFVGPRLILWGHWDPLFQISDDSAHEFQSQGGSVVTCTLLSLACNDPQSSLVARPGIKPRSLTPEVNTIPLRQPDPGLWMYQQVHV